mgnify:FL=1
MYMAEYKLATLGGGCFWCIETAFNRLKGVETAISGYCGGHTPDPRYKEICQGDTGHAEVVQIRYDEAQISFSRLLDAFFHLHDPTQLNRQGNDMGTQYRSVIFYHDENQQAEAQQAINDLGDSKVWPAPIVTELAPIARFYPAEDYHQDYFNQNPNQPYCALLINPKLKSFQAQFNEWLKPD